MPYKKEWNNWWFPTVPSGFFFSPYTCKMHPCFKCYNSHQSYLFLNMYQSYIGLGRRLGTSWNVFHSYITFFIIEKRSTTRIWRWNSSGKRPIWCHMDTYKCILKHRHQCVPIFLPNLPDGTFLQLAPLPPIKLSAMVSYIIPSYSTIS